MMTKVTAAPANFIGCDVGKTDIVVFDSRTSQTRTIANRAADLARFARRWMTLALRFVRPPAATRMACCVPCEGRARRTPRRRPQGEAFIRSFGTLGKTDAIDARALATYAP